MSGTVNKQAASLLGDLEAMRLMLTSAVAEPPLLTQRIVVPAVPLLSEIVAQPNSAVAHSKEFSGLSTQSQLQALTQSIIEALIVEYTPQMQAELAQRLQQPVAELLSKTTPK